MVEDIQSETYSIDPRLMTRTFCRNQIVKCRRKFSAVKFVFSLTFHAYKKYGLSCVVINYICSFSVPVDVYVLLFLQRGRISSQLDSLTEQINYPYYAKIETRLAFPAPLYCTYTVACVQYVIHFFCMQSYTISHLHSLSTLFRTVFAGDF